MELDELKSMWQAKEANLEKSANLNSQLLDKMESHKIQSILKPQLVKNQIVLVLHLLFIAGLSIFLVYHISELPYAASALVLFFFYVYLTVNCVQQIKAIWNVDRCIDIVGKQTALAVLNTYILHYPRLSLLSIPVFLSFPVVVMKALIDLKLNYFGGMDIITHTNGKWWTVELIVYIVFIPAGIWFYNQVKPANMHLPWVKKIIRGMSSKQVYKAAEFLEELRKEK
jgi:hypothetical protein